MGSKAARVNTGRDVTISAFKLQNAAEGLNKCQSRLKPFAKHFTKSSQESGVRDVPFSAIVSITKETYLCFSLRVCSLTVLREWAELMEVDDKKRDQAW